MGMYVFSPVLVLLSDNVSLAHELAKMLGYDGLPGEDRKLLTFYRALEFKKLAITRPEQFFNRVRLLPFYYSAKS